MSDNKILPFNEIRKARGLPTLAYHENAREHASRLVGACEAIGIPYCSFFVPTASGAYIVTIDRAPTFVVNDVYILPPDGGN